MPAEDAGRIVVAVMARRLLATLSLCALLTACAPPPPRRPLPPSSRAPLGDDELALEGARLRGRAEARFAEQKRSVERVGQRLLEAIPGHPNVQFVIVNGDPSINAGATFGQVAITSGMLSFVRSDDEMAVVLGHELAHIEQGHVLKGAVGNLALNVLAIVIEARAPGAGQAAGGIGQLFLNHYTQTQEREADEVGLGYAYAAGFDPRPAVDVQERMAVEIPQTMSAGYFDTHPSSVERAVAARRRAEELLAQGEPPGREDVLARERADRPAASPRASRDRDDAAAFTSRPAASSPVRASRDGEPRDGGDGCRRAAVYAEMARDSSDPAERKELQDRARRHCPTLADTHRDRGDPAADWSEPADTY